MWLTRNSRKTRDAHIGAAAFVAALCCAIALILSGIANAVEGSVHNARDTMRLAPTTGEIVVVEIDGRSLQALDTFPWPRSYHAAAIKELEQLGASQIAFDIDFSSRSTPEEDAQLSQAFSELEQPAILATFRQFNLAGEEQTISEALPIPSLREHTFMASVNVHPSAEGSILDYPYGVTTNETPRPSLANMLAKSAGEVDATFQVDQAIDMRTIPRVSFVDLIEGKVARETVEGKQVVIGATAIELGDRYPTALFGVQPGVFVHVQATETLLQNRDRTSSTQWLPLAIAVLALGAFLFLRMRSGKGGSFANAFAVGLGGLIVVCALILDRFSLTYIALAGVICFLFCFAVFRSALVAAANLQAERMTNTASELPNRAAIKAAMRERHGAMVAVARIADFADVIRVVGEEHWEDIDRSIAHRLRLVADREDVYWLGNGLFGWFMPKEHSYDPETAFATARSLFNSAFEIEGQKLKLLPHFGCSVESIGEAEDASELARQRGFAWSQSAVALQEETQFRQRLLGELDEALTNDAITVAFQPKLRLSDGVCCACECLVRWDSEQLGRISPADFIPILEEKGRIHDLTIFVLREAIRRRDEAFASGHQVNLAVNVSAQLLSDDGFVSAAVLLLEQSEAKTRGGITFEITESAPLSDSGTARATLDKFVEAGARISIDDYGTGQASLNYLQDFPAREIKLDQSFVRNLIEDRKDRIMVQSTIDLAHALGFEIVAEGIEDAETLKVLKDLGCDYGQGWEIGRPTDWHGFAASLGQVRAKAKAA